MKYNNQICPVCDKKFTEGDDVVVCPECGTPHHRECYNSLGKCKNDELHKSGYSYKMIEVKDEGIDVLIDDEIKNVNSVKTENNDKTVKIEINAENPSKEDLESVVKELISSINGKTADQIIIDGKEATYYEAAIGKNQNYYIPRFIILEGTGKKFLLNVAAFIFPLTWAIYRKMYKFALIALAVYMLLFSILFVPVFQNKDMQDVFTKVYQDTEFAENILLYKAGNDVELTKEQSEAIEVMDSIQISAVTYYSVFFASLLMKIIYGLYGTKMYKNKLTKNIEKVLNLPLEKEQKIKYLSVKYGVAPIILVGIFGLLEFTVFRMF